MQILERIKTMGERELEALETNAKRWETTGSESQRNQAASVLLAINAERRTRRLIENERRQNAKAKVSAKVKDMALFDRVLLAFEELPPDPWEIEVLRAVAETPGTDFNTLARQIGKKDGGYINLAVGSLCSAREHYLGEAPPATRRKGEKVFSALLIDFTPHKEADGTEWHGWTLKPEAEAALRHLGIIR